MRAVAVIPAIALLIGSAAGLLHSGLSTVSALVLTLAAAAARWAWRTDSSRLLTASIAVAFASGGVLLAENAWREAWRPTLRLAFEELARDQRDEAARRGRPLPENDTAAAIVTGRLRSDAVVRPNGEVILYFQCITGRTLAFRAELSYLLAA